MYEFIDLNGKAYPIRFGMNALRIFCRETNTSLNDLSKLGQDMSIDDACQLMLAGFIDGARKAKVECSLTTEDIADALDEDFEILTKAMGIFSNSFNPENTGNLQGSNKTPKKKKR